MMETQPLLSPISTTPRRRLFVNTSFNNGSLLPSSPLVPLPEHDEISIPIPIPSPSFKDRLIFGPASPEDLTHPLLSPHPHPPPPPTPPPIPPPNNEPFKHNLLHRSQTAPAMSAINEIMESAALANSSHHHSDSQQLSIVRQSILFLSAYLGLGVLIYSSFTSHFQVTETHPVVDALYFCIVTMCTIGYGDITPSTPFAKLFSITFVLFGFGFLDILLSSMVSYVLDLQESLLLSSIKTHQTGNSTRNYLVDVKKGRMRIRMKVGLALAVVLVCIGLGAAVLRFVEALGWLDSFYLSVMSVTTVGYGDRAFKTMTGRLFASVWLLVSTLAVARAFLYLAEARIDKRHRKLAKWVLARDMTVAEFLAADIDHNGFVSKSEFVIYKLKEMGKVAEKDVLQICDQFDRLDTGNCGKITLSDLLESHHH